MLRPVPEHGLAGVALFRGFGAPLEKSVELLFESVQPPPARKSAVLLVRTGAVEPSEQLAPP